jgi:phosphoribosylaminoimidazolecarboxamide formyltransferase/IMP cyclohydrolase
VAEAVKASPVHGAAGHALKYGENPQQSGTVEINRDCPDPLALGRFTTTDGQPISARFPTLGWVNLKDLDQGLDAITRVAAAYEFNLGKVPEIAILMEHGNPCGAAAGRGENALQLAIDSGFRASFGSFMVTNVALDDLTAFHLRQWMVADRPFAGIAAPLISPKAESYFQRKKGTCNLLVNPALSRLGLASMEKAPTVHTIRGGTVITAPNSFVPKFPDHWDTALKADMCLAWGICAVSSSNAITLVKDQILIANACGQQERAAAAELAIVQAKRTGRAAQVRGAAAVSDSFFPFADGLDVLARRHVRAIFATSGSVNDAEVAAHAKAMGVELYTVPDKTGRIFAGH